MKTPLVWMATLVCLVQITGCTKAAPDADSSPTVSVRSDTVEFAQPPTGIVSATVAPAQASTLVLPGRLVWDEEHTVRVFSPFTGRVIRSLAEPGARVSKGQGLAELASGEFVEAQAEAEKAATDLVLAQQSVRRAEDLNAAGVVAQKDVEQARADFQRAKVEHERAQTRLRQVDAGTGSNFVLRAPLAGVVVDKAVNPGQELRSDQSGPPLFVITDPTQLWVWIDAPESALIDLPDATAAPPIAIETSAFPGRSFAARIVRNAEAIDPVSRTVRLRGAVPNPRLELKAEMFVTVRLPAATSLRTSMRSVPTAAVILNGERRYVFVPSSPRAFRRMEVQVLREQGEQLTVSGLEAANEVVVEGSLYLQQFLDNAEVPTAPANATPLAGTRSDGPAITPARS